MLRRSYFIPRLSTLEIVLHVDVDDAIYRQCGCSSQVDVATDWVYARVDISYYVAVACLTRPLRGGAVRRRSCFVPRLVALDRLFYLSVDAPTPTVDTGPVAQSLRWSAERVILCDFADRYFQRVWSGTNTQVGDRVHITWRLRDAMDVLKGVG